MSVKPYYSVPPKPLNPPGTAGLRQINTDTTRGDGIASECRAQRGDRTQCGRRARRWSVRGRKTRAIETKQAACHKRDGTILSSLDAPAPCPTLTLRPSASLRSALGRDAIPACSVGVDLA